MHKSEGERTKGDGEERKFSVSDGEEGHEAIGAPMQLHGVVPWSTAKPPLQYIYKRTISGLSKHATK